MKKNKLIIILALSVFVILPAFALADGLVPCGGHGEPACSLCYLYVLAQKVMNFLAYTIAPTVAILVVAYGGFMILTAGSNPSNKQAGYKAIKAAIIGILIVFGAWIIVNEFLLFLAKDTTNTTAQVEGASGIKAPWTKVQCEVDKAY